MNRSTAPSDQKKSVFIDLTWCALCFALTAAILLFLFREKGYSPFGNLSLATLDANIQYLDFFAYLKDVMAGENSILYTFSKTLGGTNIAVFAYYLSSPFNLLLFFFDKSNLVCFFDCVVVLKLSTAAFTMSFFLRRRFQGRLNACFSVLLSISYALMQYSIAQSSNIMWLDGVYMLPLMLLGVYRLLNGGRFYLLTVSTGLSILFNWYSAGINCLFTAVWFVLEWLLSVPEQKIECKSLAVRTLKTGVTYVLAMLCGVGLSACLFLPAMTALSANGRGQLDLYLLRNVFSANVLNITQNFTVGATSFYGNVALYCGSFALLGCIGFFFTKKITPLRKIKTGIVLLFALLIYYWQPLFIIFSLFKNAESFWYRYSYVTIFLVIFIAAAFYAALDSEAMKPEMARSGNGCKAPGVHDTQANRSDLPRPGNSLKSAAFLLKVAAGYSAVLLLYAHFHPLYLPKRVYYSCAFIILIALLTGLYFQIRQNRWLGYVALLLLSGCLTVELMYNANLLMNTYSTDNAAAYASYSFSEQSQIDELKAYDTGQYRISQTTTYNVSETTHLTANYNEALAYNYWSVSGYTSDPDTLQTTLLSRLGYTTCGVNMCIVNTSILGADSLLGVKYVLSDLEINGLELVDSLGEYNGKRVYYNPYALPMAFVCSASESNETAETDVDSRNPFAYQNLLYSQLLGEEISLYVPVDYEITDVSAASQTYTLYLPDGNYAVYGNLPWESYMDAVLSVNDVYETAYSRWLSASVFYIPTESKDTTATVRISYEENLIEEEQFYALDLDALAYAAEKLSLQAADTSVIENGYAYFQVTAQSGDKLYISIPYSEGWTVTVNKTVVEPELFADCMILVSLESGINTVEMKYEVPGLQAGFAISLASVALLGFVIVTERKRKLK
ncbi:MAG: YfhO family protein [Lachnospiraceae bacterium]|nr:YfhO family protein [Lachnospiraceae bacterium]